MAISPVVRGPTVCEQVDVDPRTMNLTLHRCFRTFRVSAVPFTTQPFFVVANLASGYGRLSTHTSIRSPGATGSERCGSNFSSDAPSQSSAVTTS